MLALVLSILTAAVAGAVAVTAPQGTVEVFARGELVDVLALFQVAGIEVKFAPAAGSYSAVNADHQVQFTPGGTLAVVDGRLLALPGPVRTLDRHTVATVASAALLLAPFDWTLTASAAGLILSRGVTGDRLELSVVHAEDGATIVIAGSAKRPRVVATAGAVTLQYPGPIMLAQPWPPGPEVTSAEVQDVSLVLRLAAGLEVASSYPLEDPIRFVIKLGKPQAQGQVASARGSATVVLDPGHGGEDQGAKGPGGELEKDLTLQIARVAAAKLQGAGVTVRLTRDGDEAIALQHRTALANRLQAVVFVSIHANASVAKGAKGAETYFMNADASDQQAAASAARENATAGADTVELILWDLAHVANLNASARL
ncbi:MAG: N-acetylmuramoyl-L-alanine amidase, partial [Acidobacteria bacterium]|nr:N-acetylmuramoyl-L-alanine amidase [Acidobacteriota bacterium]